MDKLTKRIKDKMFSGSRKDRKKKRDTIGYRYGKHHITFTYENLIFIGITDGPMN